MLVLRSLAKVHAQVQSEEVVESREIFGSSTWNSRTRDGTRSTSLKMRTMLGCMNEQSVRLVCAMELRMSDGTHLHNKELVARYLVNARC